VSITGKGFAHGETHAFFTHLMDEFGAMLWGRVTYEMMESYWPSSPAAMRDWADKLEAKQKDVVSSTRLNWTGSI
jgi:dihydrofolate reductase